LKNHKTNKAKILITIAGPTAVGKTDLTLEVAKKYNSHIFSADSRQLYRELNIGTAKVDDESLAAVTHHFINHISVTDSYSVAQYEREMNALFESYFSDHDIGILSGGTGMYIKAALEGLDYFPDVSAEFVIKYENILQNVGIEALQRELQERDPDYARQVDIHNARRLVRALSVIDASGQSFSSFLARKQLKKLPFQTINICLMRDRDELYQRINTRVDQMMKNGLLEEVKALQPFKHLKSLQTVGYAELFKYLADEISLTDAIELIKRNSRRYAKRQMTWFRNQGSWTYLHADKEAEIYQYLEQKVTAIQQNTDNRDIT